MARLGAGQSRSGSLNKAFQKTVFSNGLTLLTERLEQFQSLSIGVWVKIGTRHETPRVAGVSHFLEHMLFKGTVKRSALDIARQVDQVGGEFNAFTAREHTCFHLLSLDRDFGLCMDILNDVVLNSTFKKEEFERERRVILQEVSMVEESPEELAYDLFFELIFPYHGLGRPILGTEASVKKMKREELMQFFFDHYTPDQLVISAAGNISHGMLKKKLKALEKPLWPGRSERQQDNHFLKGLPPVMTCLDRKNVWWVERDTEQVHLIWGVPGPHYASKDRYAAFLLNVYLGGGMSSTLFQEIREKNGLAYTVYSNLSPFVDAGVFSIYAATNMEQIPLCLKLIEKCVREIKDKPLPNKELKLIKENLKGTTLLTSDSVEARMSSIAKNHIFLGKYVSVEEVCRNIDAVTPADISRVANQLFRNDRRSVLALGPKASRTVASKLKITVPKEYIRN